MLMSVMMMLFGILVAFHTPETRLPINFCETEGEANTYTCRIDNPLLETTQRFIFVVRFHRTNTGPVTLSVNHTPARPLLKDIAGDLRPLDAHDILEKQIIKIVEAQDHYAFCPLDLKQPCD